MPSTPTLPNHRHASRVPLGWLHHVRLRLLLCLGLAEVPEPLSPGCHRNDFEAKLVPDLSWGRRHTPKASTTAAGGRGYFLHRDPRGAEVHEHPQPGD